MQQQTAVRKFKVRTQEGKTYIVEKQGNYVSCTCKGFNFRWKCKHSDVIKCYPG